eukprot:CAMPEP_0197630012 /NCGR_PEP_ID=MMETSP1338-20131121/7634_1 /TAXON_ID=43686 ORGANISM="Pelagodinium beii, Strain RCC1491" /NCGR_SAMPLE_ID=MMETSP1338 /ASSEMBLY_ACC=CAM_ASM_000754 /LENGTH=666 /DNA_ID=CAMNT_0043201137 /DNA_START=151 /DNA_END=2151 /DNA_ORIENTATION=-
MGSSTSARTPVTQSPPMGSSTRARTPVMHGQSPTHTPVIQAHSATPKWYSVPVAAGKDVLGSTHCSLGEAQVHGEVFDPSPLERCKAPASSPTALASEQAIPAWCKVPTPGKSLGISFFGGSKLQVEDVQSIAVGSTVFRRGEVCLYGDGSWNNEEVRDALVAQARKFHSVPGEFCANVKLCGHCLGLTSEDDESCKMKGLVPENLVYKDGSEIWVQEAGPESDIAKCACFVMGWTLNFECSSVESPVYILYYKGRPAAAWTFPDEAVQSLAAPRSFLEAMAMLQRPSGWTGSDTVAFIRGIARSKGFFDARPAWPSTTFFPPGWALLMSAIRPSVCPRTLHPDNLLSSYMDLPDRHPDGPALMLRLSLFDTLLRWPPKELGEEASKFKPQCVINGLARADKADPNDVAEGMEALLCCAAGHGEAVAGARRGEDPLLQLGVILGMRLGAASLNQSNPKLLDLSRIHRLVAASIGKLKELDPGASFLDSDTKQIEDVFQAHCSLQYTVLAAVHLLACEAYGRSPVLPNAVHLTRQWRLDVWNIIADVLEFSKKEVLPGLTDELSDQRAGFRALFGPIGLSRLPADRKGLCALRKAQIHSSMWGSATFLQQAVRQKLLPSGSGDTIKVRKGLLQMLSATKDVCINGGFPAGELPQKRLARLLERLQKA